MLAEPDTGNVRRMDGDADPQATSNDERVMKDRVKILPGQPTARTVRCDRYPTVTAIEIEVTGPGDQNTITLETDRLAAMPDTASAPGNPMTNGVRVDDHCSSAGSRLSVHEFLSNEKRPINFT